MVTTKQPILPGSDAEPGYVGWRGELLAQLALARVPGLTVYPPPAETPFDLLVVTQHGACFFVVVRAFSSIHGGMPEFESVETLEWPVERSLIEFAHSAGCPAVLFVFDADTDAGRFERLDEVAASEVKASRVNCLLRSENAISRQNLERFVSSLEKRPAA